MKQQLWKRKTVLLSIMLSLASNLSIAYKVKAEEQPKQIEINIEPAPLDDALQSVAKQFGKQIVFFSDVANDLTVQKYTGFYTEQEALEMLLKNTGLVYKYINKKTIAIEKKKNKPTTSTSEKKLIVPKKEQSRIKKIESTAIEKITVTAQRRVQNLQDVPLAITAFNGDDLD